MQKYKLYILLKGIIILVEYLWLNDKMKKQTTEKIKLWGIVQGVGFRPYVARIAYDMGIKGRVRNIGGLVEITVTDKKERITEFLDVLKKEKPVPAEIVHISRETLPLEFFGHFTIKQSDDGDKETAMIPADLAVCPDCLREMNDEDDPRRGHPFISCMVCGPRYTITDRFPYDRDNTSMVDFDMCRYCREEYKDIRNRRYHAQTISCYDCGPQMEMYPEDEENIQNDEDLTKRNRKILEYAASLLKKGKVIAFKSMGGYNLMADPKNQEATSALREIKAREEKPFAVLFRDEKQIGEYCIMDETEEKLISSSARPIVLLEKRSEGMPQKGGVRGKWLPEFEKSRFIGSFLPSFGGQYTLLDFVGGPLISTSANLSDMPMIKSDEEMTEMTKREPRIAAVFFNKRDIRVSVDDSVVRVIDNNPQMIRRSKGYAPVPLYLGTNNSNEKSKKTDGKKADRKITDGKDPSDMQIFAAGGHLKNSFALSKGPFVYVSQYFGDLDSRENQVIYEDSLTHMKELFRISPGAVVCDMHPSYYTTGYAEKYAKDNKIPLLMVQHHHAHIASVMAEHDLDGPVIGVGFDGTGYGMDGAIWGGEFLLCRESDFERKAHLKYIKMIGGDSSMKEGWKSALSYIRAAEEGPENGTGLDGPRQIVPDIKEIVEYARENSFTERINREVTAEGMAAGGLGAADLVNTALARDINTINSSSIGRLFDAVASMLDICDNNSYEGRCAIMLEDAAARALMNKAEDRADKLALKFHFMIAEMILEQCRIIREEEGTDGKVALSGGVFQNRILMDKTLSLLRDNGFKPYYNISVSPNDGGIALGQTYITTQMIRSEKWPSKK